jgi:hypothetical protein
MVDFNFNINRQGIRGRKGDKGADGFTPSISESVNTVDEYKLLISNQFNEFETPNLRGNINVLDNGGQYLKYNADTQQISAEQLNTATADIIGGVVLSTDEKFNTGDENSVLTPAILRDNLTSMVEISNGLTKTVGETGVITISGETLESKLTDVRGIAEEAEAQAVNANNLIQSLQVEVDSNTADINTIRNTLLPKKQDKLTQGDNITLTPLSDGTVEISATGGGSQYVLPAATTTSLGGVKVGTNLTVTPDGTISTDVSATEIEELGNELNDISDRVTTAEGKITNLGSQVSAIEDELPTFATTDKAGIVKPDGTTITVDTDGTIHAVGGGGGSTPDNMVTTDTKQSITGIKSLKGCDLIFEDSLGYHAVILSHAPNIGGDAGINCSGTFKVSGNSIEFGRSAGFTYNGEGIIISAGSKSGLYVTNDGTYTRDHAGNEAKVITENDISTIINPWVDNKLNMIVDKTFEADESIEVDFTEYLPKDGKNYEVMVAVFIRAGNTVDNSTGAYVRTSIFTGTIRLCRCITRVNNGSATAAGSCIIPIGTDRKLTYINGDSVGTSGNCGLQALGYRRIG